MSQIEINTTNENNFIFIFDLDGTLLDNMEFFFETLPKQIAEYYNVEYFADIKNFYYDQMYDTFIGPNNHKKSSIFKSILKVAKKFGIPWYKRYKFLKKTHEFYKEGIINMKIFPRVLETLEFLKKKGNFLAILTLNSLEEINSRFLNNKEFLEQFNGNIIARDNIRYTKPSPDGIFKICTDLNIPPKNTIMVGDFLADIEAGKNAGSVTIGVLSGFSSFDMMKKNNPDFIFEDINEIPKHYDEIIANIKSKR